MRNTILALGLVLTSSLALAQSAGNPESDAKPVQKPPRMERLQNDLGLTDEQVQKMREIRDNGGSREEMQAVLTPEQRVKAMQFRKERKGEHAERRAFMEQQLGLSEEQKQKLATIRSAGGSREEMRAVLTPEQQAKFDEMRSKRDGKGPKWGTKPAAQQAVEAPAS
ncbi:MAG: hypothetical protein R3E64_18325 [Halioglobus sp.]